MDDYNDPRDLTIMTPLQRVHSSFLAIARGMDQNEPIMDHEDFTVADVVRATKNREWSENGSEGVRLVENQADLL